MIDVIGRAQSGRYAGFEPRFAILQQPNGTIFASSDPRRFPAQSAIPDELREQFAADDDIVAIDFDNGRAWLAKTLRTKGFSAVRLFAEVDIAASLRGHREILPTATFVILGLELAIMLGGYFTFRAVMPHPPTDEEADFITELVEEQRAELKAMTSRELLDFIDNKFEERFGRRLR